MFKQSLFVLTTVMSHPVAHRAVADAGPKAHSIDSGMPLVADVAGARYAWASDEPMHKTKPMVASRAAKSSRLHET